MMRCAGAVEGNIVNFNFVGNDCGELPKPATLTFHDEENGKAQGSQDQLEKRRPGLLQLNFEKMPNKK